MPAHLADRAPRVVTLDNGRETWVYEDRFYPQVGLNAVVGRPKAEWNMEPARFDEMRNGCYDIEARVADMDLDGVYASVCFPSLIAGLRRHRLLREQGPGARARRAPGVERLAHRRVGGAAPGPRDPAAARLARRSGGRGGRHPGQRGPRLQGRQLPREPGRPPAALDPHRSLGSGAARVRRDRDRALPAQRIVLVDRPRVRRARRSRCTRACSRSTRSSPRPTGCGRASRRASPTSRSRSPKAASAGCRCSSIASPTCSTTRRSVPTVGTTRRLPDRRAAPQLLVLRDRRRLDDRVARAHRHRPHLPRERLSARRFDLARHAGARPRRSRRVLARRGSQADVGERVEAVPPSRPAGAADPMSYTQDAVSGAGAHAIEGLFEVAAANDPIPAYQQVHAECPVARTPGMFGEGVWLTRYEDVMWAFKHPEVFSSQDVVKIGNEVPLIPLSVDPPDHAKYRRLLDPQFSPRKMAELEPEMRKLVDEVIDGFIDRGECDFHEDFATPLPSTFFIALMGLPQSDLPRFLKWRDDTIRPAADTMEEAQAIREASGPRHHRVLRARARRTARRARRRSPAEHARARRGRRPAAHARRAARHVPPLDARWTRHRDRDPRLHDHVPRVAPRTPAGDPRRSRADSRRGRGAAPPPDAGDDGAAQDHPGRRDRRRDVPRRRHRDAAHRRGQHRRAPSSRTPTRSASTAAATATSRSAAARTAASARTSRASSCSVALEQFHRRIPEYAIPDGAEINFSPGIRQAEHLPLTFPVRAAG